MTLDFKHSNIHYTVEGNGETIVLLHGFLETLEMWNDLVPEFSETNQVVCIDLLGHGKTDCLGYVHTMDTMAEAVFAVLEHLAVETAYIIGHSMGGYVALALAEKHPDLFKGLCLMNSTFEADNKERQRIRTRACKMAKTNYDSLVQLSFSNLFAPESKEHFKMAYENALQIALRTPVQGYIAAQEGMKIRPNRLEVFKSLNAKKLIIAGKKDGLIDSEQLIAQIKGTSIDFVQFSAGHMSHIENKSELTYNILRFVENLSL